MKQIFLIICMFICVSCEKPYNKGEIIEKQYSSYKYLIYKDIKGEINKVGAQDWFWDIAEIGDSLIFYTTTVKLKK